MYALRNILYHPVDLTDNLPNSGIDPETVPKSEEQFLTPIKTI